MKLRVAKLEDQKTITKLIETSVRTLSLPDYSPAQIEAALESAWGLDTQLIKDKSYFIVEENNQAIACGGWSFRKTLFGNNNEAGRDPELLNPASDFAKIRAFFVHPEHARKGLGTLIMKHCEAEAIKAGFTKLELMSTLPGLPLYEYHGFIAKDTIKYDVGHDLFIDFVPMYKILVQN